MVDWALKTEQLSIYIPHSHPELEILESVNYLRTLNAINAVSSPMQFCSKWCQQGCIKFKKCIAVSHVSRFGRLMVRR